MQAISVSVVYALASQQWCKELTVKRGTNASEAIVESAFLTEIADLNDNQLSELTIGIYGHKVGLDHLLEAGDRIEIYRPLTADPKEVRRQLAKLGKTMGSRSK